MKTLEQQIADKCIHFTGIMDKACKAGVEYDSFGEVKMGVIPCIKGGTATCDKCEYPSAEGVIKQLEEIKKDGTKGLMILLHVKAHHKKNGGNGGVILCCNGDHTLRYSVAPNGHFWVSCETCHVNLME